jgi:hypothetical protein
MLNEHIEGYIAEGKQRVQELRRYLEGTPKLPDP